jgi:uncharacterized protein (TIGR03435 family)
MGGQEFDVASIKPSPPPPGPRIRVTFEGGPGTADPTRFSCRNCSLLLLVMRAYDVQYHQVSGLSSRADLYDIEAKLPGAATKDEFRMMLRNLLSRRFGMSLHRETRQMQSYELVVGKNGPKMKQSVPGPALPVAAASTSSPTVLDSEGFPVLPPGQPGYASVNGRARMQVVDETMDQLAARIANQLDMPVINATGLAGRFDFNLHWASPSVDAADDGGLNLFSAVETQLGLRLRPGRAGVTVIVIDHVDRTPTGN